MQVEERYTRVDRNDLELTATIDDPKMLRSPSWK
jgi:aromatic ring hydroxylase